MVFGLLKNGDLDVEWSHKESLPIRIKRGNEYVGKLVHQFERYPVLYTIDRKHFVSLTTRDVAAEEVKTDMTTPHSKRSEKYNRYHTTA